MTRTTTEFFLCYLIEIFAFTICFHILLRDSSTFRSVDDSFVVVITMLLGELDYELMTKSGDNVMLVKLIILLFIMMMSIVLINLIIGLAINDIATLRYTLK